MGILLGDLRGARTSSLDFHDVSLQGTDEAPNIPASRLILSIRSPVFHKMLYGEFKESGSVPLAFSAAILNHIVQYCYTDDVPHIETEDANGLPVLINESDIRETIRLRSAADFFELSDLFDALTTHLSVLLTDHCQMACTVLDELYAVGAAGSVLGEICLHVVQVKGEYILLPTDKDARQQWSGVGACCPEVLATVLSEEVVGPRADNLIVKCLHIWEDMSPNLLSALDIVPAPLRKLADRIELKHVAASQLTNLMFSNLFAKDAIYEAFKHHAIAAEHTGAPRTISFRSDFSDYVGADRCCIVKGDHEDVNGVYRKVKNNNGSGNSSAGAVLYTKQGPYEGKGNATFKIFPTKTAVQLGQLGCDCVERWWLSVSSAPHNVVARDTPIYEAMPDCGDPEKAPMFGWRVIPPREQESSSNSSSNSNTAQDRLVVLCIN